MNATGRVAHGWLALAAVLISVPAAAGEIPPVKLAPHQSWVPQAVVPLLAKPPAVDGAVGDAEWAGATAFTGLTPNCHPYNPYVQPECIQGHVFLCRDKQTLFVGLRSPLPPPTKTGERLRSGGKGNDDAGGIESGDHWEVRLQVPNPAKELVEYLFKLNPAGRFSDQRVTPQDQGKNRHVAGIEWTSGATAAARIDEARGVWEAELAIPFAALGFADGAPVGAAWRAMFLRGHGYSGPARGEWNGAAAHFMGDAFDGQAGYVVIGDAVPAFQLLRLGELRDYRLAPVFRLANPTAAPREVTVRIAAESGAAVLVEERKTFTLAPGATLAPEWPAAAFEPPAGMSARVRIEALAGADLLYLGEVQTIRMTQSEYKSYALGPNAWPFASPWATAWELKIASYPYYDAVEASVDASLAYLPEALRSAPRCALSLAAAGAGQPRTETIELKSGKGAFTFEKFALKPGAYEVKGQLLDAEGKPVGDPVVRRFERQAFPWERNTIGVSDKVFAPFRAIQVDKAAGTLSPWGRVYKLGACGLPGGIVAGPEAPFPGQEICGPVRVEATINGAVQVFSGQGAITAAEPGIVRMKGAGEARGLKLAAEAFMQYDGWWQFALTVSPDGPVNIDRLEVVIPLARNADTMWFYRGRFDVSSGGLRKGEGEIWNNLKKQKHGNPENHFTPVLAVGTGDAALWWYADGDESWLLDYAKASQSVVRGPDGALSLRLAVVNTLATMAKPLTLSFAVSANPFRPDPPRRRFLQWGGSGRIHDTSGYAYWGSGVDSIAPATDEARTALAAGLAKWVAAAKPEREKAIAAWAPPGFETTYPLVLYNSGELIGPSMPEYATFAGEWGGEVPVEYVPEYKDSDRHSRINFRGVYQQDWRSRPLSLGPALADLVPSVVDCRVWHYKQNMETLGVDGYWFDNASIWPGTRLITGRACRTADGTVRPRYPVFARRELFRRLFVLYKEAGREPWVLLNTHTTCEFAAWRWSIESDSYVYNYGGDLYESLERQQQYDIDSRIVEVDAEVGDPVARFRGHQCLRRIPGAMVSNLQPRDPSGVHGSRSVLGLSLLHDFGVESGVHLEELDRVRRALREFGLFTDDAIRFLPYWRSAPALAFSQPGVLVSAYVNPATREALAVIVNPAKEKTTGVLTVRAKELGLAGAAKAIDAETASEAGKDTALEAKPGEGTLSIQIELPSREFRLVRISG